MDWLIDDPTLVYMMLAIVAIGLAVGWWRTRQRKLALGAGIAVLLIGVVWLLCFLIPTDAKKIAHALQEMSDGVRAHDLDRIFSQVSDQFQQGPPTFGGSLDKAAFRQRSEGIIQDRSVEEVPIWDIKVEKLSRQERSAQVVCSAKPKGNWTSGAFYIIRSQFVLDADGQWRMKGFEVCNPAVNTREGIRIPGT
jgi:hypothetical protein